MVKCKNCGFKFPSFTQINEVAFKTAVLTNNLEECPGCSEILAYGKRDYFFEWFIWPDLVRETNSFSYGIRKPQEAQPQW